MKELLPDYIPLAELVDEDEAEVVSPAVVTGIIEMLQEECAVPKLTSAGTVPALDCTRPMDRRSAIGDKSTEQQTKNGEYNLNRTI